MCIYPVIRTLKKVEDLLSYGILMNVMPMMQLIAWMERYLMAGNCEFSLQNMLGHLWHDEQGTHHLHRRIEEVGEDHIQDLDPGHEIAVVDRAVVRTAGVVETMTDTTGQVEDADLVAELADQVVAEVQVKMAGKNEVEAIHQIVRKIIKAAVAAAVVTVDESELWRQWQETLGIGDKLNSFIRSLLKTQTGINLICCI